MAVITLIMRGSQRETPQAHMLTYLKSINSWRDSYAVLKHVCERVSALTCGGRQVREQEDCLLSLSHTHSFSLSHTHSFSLSLTHTLCISPSLSLSQNSHALCPVFELLQQQHALLHTHTHSHTYKHTQGSCKMN